MAIPSTELPKWLHTTRAAVTVTPQWLAFTQAVNDEIDRQLAREQLDVRARPALAAVFVLTQSRRAVFCRFAR